MAIVLLVLLLAVPVILRIALEIRTARRAGMSEATPVCVNCHYPLGGWSSPRCPECGKDIQAIGVRTGPRIRQAGLSVLVVVASLLVVGPASFGVFGWVFHTEESQWERSWYSDSIDGLSFCIRSDYLWRRFPSRWDQQTTLETTRFDESRHLQGKSTLIFDYDEPVPTTEQLREQIHAVVADGTRSDQIELQVELVLGILTAFRSVQVANPLEPSAAFNAPLGPMLSVTGSGYSATNSPAWPALVLTVLMVLVAIYIGLRGVRMRCQGGWRSPFVGEWAKKAE